MEEAIRRAAALLGRFVDGHCETELREYCTEMLAELLRSEGWPADQDGWAATVTAAIEDVVEDEACAETVVDRMLAAGVATLRAGEDAAGGSNSGLSSGGSSSGARVRAGDYGLAVLPEDGEWHDVLVEEVNEELKLALIAFVEYQKRSQVPLASIRSEASVAGAGGGLDEPGDSSGAVGRCQLCARDIKLTRHHLIPRMVHARYLKRGYGRDALNATIDICRACHSTVHRAEDEKTLAASYHSLELIRAHPQVQAWVAFAAKSGKQTKWDANCMLEAARKRKRHARGGRS